MVPSVQKYTIPLLLIVWFWVWGICPWNSASAAAQVVEAAHADHGHHGVDDTHHASKGTEHSCSGAISFSKSNLKADQSLCHSAVTQDLSLLTDPAGPLNPIDGYLKPIFERNTLPKLLTEYYQLYSVYRI